MQMAAPEATDLSTESNATRKLYGMDDPETANFARECIMARRLAERGVRFIQVSHAHSLKFNNEQWDQHSHLEKGTSRPSDTAARAAPVPPQGRPQSPQLPGHQECRARTRSAPGRDQRDRGARLVGSVCQGGAGTA